MTTILACAGSGLMVADSRVGDTSGIKWTAPKVERIGGSLFGVAGDDCDIERMLKWLRTKRTGKMPKTKDFQAVELDDEGVWAWAWDASGRYPVGRKFHAVGTGAAAALGAMLAGASPIHAVEIACQIDTESEGPVQVVHLKEGARGSA